MSGVISRFLITPRVFALFESGLSLRCRPLLLFQFPMKFKKFSICLGSDVEHLVALVLGDSCPARFACCLLGKALKHMRLLRVYKPYTLSQQRCSHNSSPRLLKRYKGEIIRAQPVAF